MSIPLPPARRPGSPGWYVDPDEPRRERWWTGTEWTLAIAPLARSPFGADFERSMRPAVNRIAGLVRYVSFGALVALVVAVVDGSVLGDGAPSGLAVVALVAAFILGAAGTALGVAGLRRAELQGGIGAARASMVLGIAAIVLGVIALLVR